MLSPVFQEPQNVVSPTLHWLTSKTNNFTKIYTFPKNLGVSNLNKDEKHPYERVWTKDDENYAFLKNDNSGDVFLSAASGFLMAKEADFPVEPTIELGSHGSDPERPKLRPILYATGPTITPGELTNRISMLDIAPSLYELLNLQAPDFVEGKSIWSREN